MVGSKRPLTVSRARIEALLADAASLDTLALMNVGTFRRNRTSAKSAATSAA